MENLKSFEEFLNESIKETGLMVIGRTDSDNKKIEAAIEDAGFHGEWNSREKYWFFPEKKSEYDNLERELDKVFIKKGIDARFEGI